MRESLPPPPTHLLAQLLVDRLVGWMLRRVYEVKPMAATAARGFFCRARLLLYFFARLAARLRTFLLLLLLLLQLIRWHILPALPPLPRLLLTSAKPLGRPLKELLLVVLDEGLDSLGDCIRCRGLGRLRGESTEHGAGEQDEGEQDEGERIEGDSKMRESLAP